MTTNEIVRQLRNGLRVGITSDLIEQAADRLEEQEKIINQYHRADTFLNAHGWKWEDVEDDNG